MNIVSNACKHHGVHYHVTWERLHRDSNTKVWSWGYFQRNFKEENDCNALFNELYTFDEKRIRNVCVIKYISYEHHNAVDITTSYLQRETFRALVKLIALLENQHSTPKVNTELEEFHPAVAQWVTQKVAQAVNTPEEKSTPGITSHDEMLKDMHAALDNEVEM